jgi:hypothetical protein
VPLKIEEADRAKIASIKCYVKPPGGSWIVSDTGNAQTGRFNYNAAEDGEYCFSFATVDAAGRESPSHIEREAPRLIVIVDTKPPEFMVAPVTVASGQSYVQCTMKDANPDMATVTAEAEMADGTFMPLLPVDTNVPGFFRVPATGMPNRVRVGGKDKAGNAAMNLVSVVSAVASPPTITAAEPRKEPMLPSLPIPKPEPLAVVTQSPKLEPIPAPKSVGSGLILPGMAQPVSINAAAKPLETIPKPAPPREMTAPMAVPVLAVPAPVVPAPAAPVPAVPAPVVPVPAVPAPLVPAPEVPMPAMPRVAEKQPTPEPPEPVSTTVDQLINSHRCVLNYAIDGINPSAVEKVEAYATRDEGKTWQKLGEDPDRTSPIELTLPGDGRYGIVIVISAVGRPGQPPVAGEQADWWVEADTTAPEVTLESATPGVGDDAGMLILKWHVSDRNLKPDAVEFAWSAAPEGPWQTIAKGLKAEGLYRWPVPREAGSKTYLKIEAADKAGNIGRAATSQPVPIEVGRPRAKVLGINPAAMKQ